MDLEKEIENRKKELIALIAETENTEAKAMLQKALEALN